MRNTIYKYISIFPFLALFVFISEAYAVVDDGLKVKYVGPENIKNIPNKVRKQLMATGCQVVLSRRGRYDKPGVWHPHVIKGEFFGKSTHDLVVVCKEKDVFIVRIFSDSEPSCNITIPVQNSITSFSKKTLAPFGIQSVGQDINYGYVGVSRWTPKVFAKTYEWNWKAAHGKLSSRYSTKYTKTKVISRKELPKINHDGLRITIGSLNSLSVTFYCHEKQWLRLIEYLYIMS